MTHVPELVADSGPVAALPALSTLPTPPTQVITCYWYREGNNFGDWLSPFILNQVLVQHLPEHAERWKVVFREASAQPPPDIIGIGSIIDRIPAQFDGYVWTTGNARKDFAAPISAAAHIVGWRGKHTLAQSPSRRADRFDSQERVGDGGLLAHLLVSPVSPVSPVSSTDNKEVAATATTALPLAIVPHVVDWPTMQGWFRQWSANHPTDKDSLMLVDLRKSPEWVMSKLARCRGVLSSSLHGLVAADALHLPSARFEVSTSAQIIGGAWKYADYYSAFGSEYESRSAAHTVTPSTTLVELERWLRPAPETVAGVQASLLQRTIKMLHDIIVFKLAHPSPAPTPSSTSATVTPPRASVTRPIHSHTKPPPKSGVKTAAPRRLVLVTGRRKVMRK